MRQFGRIGGENSESAEKVLNLQGRFRIGREDLESADAKPPELSSGTEQLRADSSICEGQNFSERSES